MRKILAVFVVLGLVFTFICQQAWADSAVIQNPANGHSYQRIDTIMTWSEAKAYCEGLGGYLATITSQDENDFVYSNLGVDGESTWLGGTDEAVEGTWEWITGEPWSYTNWAPGEPNDYLGEDYLSFKASDPFQWNDLGNAGTGSYIPSSLICEWDEEESQGIISGFVTEADYFPIANARVKLFQGATLLDSTRTDANGHYEFSNLADGKYNLKARKRGYVRDSKTGKVQQARPWGKQEFINLILNPYAD